MGSFHIVAFGGKDHVFGFGCIQNEFVICQQRWALDTSKVTMIMVQILSKKVLTIQY